MQAEPSPSMQGWGQGTSLHIIVKYLLLKAWHTIVCPFL